MISSLEVEVFGAEIKWQSLEGRLKYERNVRVIDCCVPEEQAEKSLAEAVLTVHAAHVFVQSIVAKGKILDIKVLLLVRVEIHRLLDYVSIIGANCSEGFCSHTQQMNSFFRAKLDRFWTNLLVIHFYFFVGVSGSIDIEVDLLLGLFFLLRFLWLQLFFEKFFHLE